MRTRAAIIRETPGTFEVVDIDLDDPRQGEIRVKLTATGLCQVPNIVRDRGPGVVKASLKLFGEQVVPELNKMGVQTPAGV